MKRTNLLLGLALLLLGGFLLLVNLNIVPMQNNLVVAGVFFTGALLFLAVFFTNGVQQWWWLMPATTLSAVGGAIVFSESGLPGEWIGALFVLAVAIPFWVAYLGNRENWWALIPGGVLLFVGILIVGTSTRVPDEYWAAMLLGGIGLVFLVVYLTNRERWWALIPGGTMMMVAILVAGTATPIADEYWVALMLAGMGAVFAMVYFTRRSNWWAIIPAGALVGAGATVMLAGMPLSESLQIRLLGGSFLLIMGLTFGALWLLREEHPTKWAKYPAVVAGSIGALVMVIGRNAEYVWPLILILTGGWMLWRSRMRG